MAVVAGHEFLTHYVEYFQGAVVGACVYFGLVLREGYRPDKLIVGLEWHQPLLLLFLDVRVQHIHLAIVVARSQQLPGIRAGDRCKEHFAGFQLPSGLPGLHIEELYLAQVPADDQLIVHESQLPGAHHWHIDSRCLL